MIKKIVILFSTVTFSGFCSSKPKSGSGPSFESLGSDPDT
jgi:hypothetical protein